MVRCISISNHPHLSAVVPEADSDTHLFVIYAYRFKSWGDHRTLDGCVGACGWCRGYGHGRGGVSVDALMAMQGPQIWVHQSLSAVDYIFWLFLCSSLLGLNKSRFIGYYLLLVVLFLDTFFMAWGTHTNTTCHFFDSTYKECSQNFAWRLLRGRMFFIV